MPVYFEFALKASICLAVIYLFYTLLLKRITHYTWNRYFLLIFSILSFIVPVINIGVFVEARQLETVSIINQIPSINSFEISDEVISQATFDYWRIVSAVVVLVSLVLVIRLLIQILSIRRIKSKATLLAAGKVNIYNLSDRVLPFSFLNSIFINTDNYNPSELPEIIEHEKVHVQQKHTIDVLITEIICIVNWYNPFAWLLKKAVRENLEFIADDAVIRKGIDKKSYQYLLLKVTGDMPSSITSSFTFSSLKNRILMMNKTKTSRFHLLKFALLVPMLLVLLLAFRNSVGDKADTVALNGSSAETYILSSLTYSIADATVKAIVIKESDKSFLKPGEVLDLKLIYNEKDRLKSLLEKNGYTNLRSNAVGFMIDTASVNNSFSVEVKIDTNPEQVSGTPVPPSTEQARAAALEKAKMQSIPFLQPYPSGFDLHLNKAQTKSADGKIKPGC